MKTYSIFIDIGLLGFMLGLGTLISGWNPFYEYSFVLMVEAGIVFIAGLVMMENYHDEMYSNEL